MWFASGIVMMYVPYPRLTERERIALLPDIDAAQVRVSPEDALRGAGATRFPDALRLGMSAGEPVFHMADGAARRTVSARDGRLIAGFAPADALAVVRGLRVDAARARVDTLARDQWTVAQGFDTHRPLHKVVVDDEAGSELYVSSRTGEIVQETTRSERFWNWLGAVPHWLYLTGLRQDADLWRQVVLWTSGPATLGAVAGLCVGILRLRPRRRYRDARMSPYAGWMKWHHVAGIAAGLFVTTWLASGWLSVNPLRLFSRAVTPPDRLRAYAGQDAPILPIATTSVAEMARSGVRELRFAWVGGRPLAVATDAAFGQRVLDAATGRPADLPPDVLAAAARRLIPDGRVVETTLLTAEDFYWYSHHFERRLPVLRVIFADPAQTWIHLDPASGEVLGRTDRSGRAYHWLFNGLHDFDLAVLLRRRPAWDVLVWLLSLGGLIVSVSGVVIGWRRLGRRFAGR